MEVHLACHMHIVGRLYHFICIAHMLDTYNKLLMYVNLSQAIFFITSSFLIPFSKWPSYKVPYILILVQSHHHPTSMDMVPIHISSSKVLQTGQMSSSILWKVMAATVNVGITDGSSSQISSNTSAKMMSYRQSRMIAFSSWMSSLHLVPRDRVITSKVFSAMKQPIDTSHQRSITTCWRCWFRLNP